MSILSENADSNKYYKHHGQKRPLRNIAKEAHLVLQMSPNPRLPSVVLVLNWISHAFGEETVVNVTTANDLGRPGIEEEVLGPLRVWHITFIVVSILLIILVTVCCCLDIRVPRTRQEIEHNYQKRLINEKYLRALERTPDQLIQQHRDTEAAENQRIETISQLVTSQTSSKAISPANRMKRAVALSALKENGTGVMAANKEDTTNGRRFKGGIGTPLPINPRDILALVAQQKRNA